MPASRGSRGHGLFHRSRRPSLLLLLLLLLLLRGHRPAGPNTASVSGTNARRPSRRVAHTHFLGWSRVRAGPDAVLLFLVGFLAASFFLPGRLIWTL